MDFHSISFVLGSVGWDTNSFSHFKMLILYFKLESLLRVFLKKILSHESF